MRPDIEFAGHPAPSVMDENLHPTSRMAESRRQSHGAALGGAASDEHLQAEVRPAVHGPSLSKGLTLIVI